MLPKKARLRAWDGTYTPDMFFRPKKKKFPEFWEISVWAFTLDPDRPICNRKGEEFAGFEYVDHVTEELRKMCVGFYLPMRVHWTAQISTNVRYIMPHMIRRIICIDLPQFSTNGTQPANAKKTEYGSGDVRDSQYDSRWHYVHSWMSMYCTPGWDRKLGQFKENHAWWQLAHASLVDPYKESNTPDSMKTKEALTPHYPTII